MFCIYFNRKYTFFNYCYIHLVILLSLFIFFKIFALGNIIYYYRTICDSFVAFIFIKNILQFKGFTACPRLFDIYLYKIYFTVRGFTAYLGLFEMLMTGKFHWNKLLTFILILFIITLNFTGMVPLFGVASAASIVDPSLPGIPVDIGHYYDDGDGNGPLLDDSYLFRSQTVQSGVQPLPDWTWTKAGTYEVNRIEIIDLSLSNVTNHWIYNPSAGDYVLYQSLEGHGRYAENVYGNSYLFASSEAFYDFDTGSYCLQGINLIGNGWLTNYPSNPTNYTFNFYYGGSTLSGFSETPSTSSYESIDIGDLYTFEDNHRYQVLIYYEKIENPGPYSYLHVIHNYDGVMVSQSAPYYDCEEVNADRISSGLYNFENKINADYMDYSYIYESMTLHYETNTPLITFYGSDDGFYSTHSETLIVGDVFDAFAYSTQNDFNNSSVTGPITIFDQFATRNLLSLIEPENDYPWWNSSIMKVSGYPDYVSWAFMFGSLYPLTGSPITYFRDGNTNLGNNISYSNYEYNFEEGLHYVLIVNYKHGIPVTHHYMDGLTEETFTEGKVADYNINTDLPDWKRDKSGYDLTRIEVIESSNWLNVTHYSGGIEDPSSFISSESYVVFEGAKVTIRDFLIWNGYSSIMFSGYTVNEGDSFWYGTTNQSDTLIMEAGKNILNLFYEGRPKSISTIATADGSYLRTIWDNKSPFPAHILGNSTTNAKYQFSEGKMYEVHYYYVTGSPTTFTLTYDANGADSGNPPVDNNDYPYGSYAIVHPNIDLQRSGYEFICWNDEADGKGNSYYPGIGYDNAVFMDDDKTLYAVWSSSLNIPLTHVYINYPAIQYTESETKTVATHTPIILNDWYKAIHNSVYFVPIKIVINESQNGGATTTTVFSNGISYSFQSFTFENDKDYDVTIYYGIDYISPFNITYFPNGATGDVPIDSFNPYFIGHSITILDNLGAAGDGANILEKTGEVFVGWNTKADGSGISFSPNDVVIFDFVTLYDAINDNYDGIDLYAQWSSGGDEIPVTHFYLRNGANPSLYTTFNETKIVTRDTITNLSGWYRLDDGTGYPYRSPYIILVREQADSSSSPNMFLVSVSTPEITFDDGKDYHVTIYYLVFNATSPNGVIYFPNGATSGVVPRDPIGMYYQLGMPVTVLGNIGQAGDGTDILQRPGYEFTEWNRKDDGTGDSHAPYSQFAYPFSSGIVELHAQWNPIPYNVTFNAMGGTFNSAAEIVATPVSSSLAYDRGQTDSSSNKLLIVSNIVYDSFITAPSPATIKGAENLEGWYTTSDYQSGTKWNFDTNTVTEDVTLYAKWTSNLQYYVTYNYGRSTSGTAPVDTLSPYHSGETVEVLDNTNLARSGNVFGGWNKSSLTGTTVDYAFGDTFIMPSSHVNLYPVWLPAYYVTYNYGRSTSGTAPVDNLNPYLPGETVEVLDNTNLARTGYVFGGWNKSSLTGTTVDYTFGDTFIMPSSGVNLYPVWVQKYHVTYLNSYAESGTAPVDTLSPYLPGETVEVLDNIDLVRTGYVFAGWNKSSIVGTTADYTFGDTFLMPSSGVNLYPVWARAYYVTYNYGMSTGGTAPVDNLNPYLPGETVEVLDNTNLVRTGYVFAGWNNSSIVGKHVTGSN